MFVDERMLSESPPKVFNHSFIINPERLMRGIRIFAYSSNKSNLLYYACVFLGLPVIIHANPMAVHENAFFNLKIVFTPSLEYDNSYILS
jgi:hypothetical protein